MRNIISILVFVLGTCGFFGANSYNENYYTMPCEVIEVQADEIVVTEVTGNDWVVYAEGYKIGDKVKATFYNNHTENNRFDDEIVNLKRI